MNDNEPTEDESTDDEIAAAPQADEDDDTEGHKVRD